MCSGNPWEVAMTTKMDVNNPLFFFIFFKMVNPLQYRRRVVTSVGGLCNVVSFGITATPGTKA
jgi:hypothetical protein